MALDGIILHKITAGIKEVLPARIQKIYAISPMEILFQLHGPEGRQQLMISCHSVYNRMLLTKRSYPAPMEPGNFVMVLRKHLEGASIEDVQQAELDRWCTFTIRRRNNLGDMEKLRLVVELMGNYANIILVGADGRIIDALKRIPPFENNRRTIQAGAAFTEVEPQHKKNPFVEKTVDSDKSLTAQFGGFSPFLSKEVEYRMQKGQSFSSIMEEIDDSNMLYIANDADKPVFHCIDLTHVGKCRSYPLFEAFDILYYHREEKERIRMMTGDLVHFCRRVLKHETQKLPRLYKEYDNALDCDKWKKYGDLLYTWNVRDTKGKNEIELEDYETGEMIKVPLDERFDGTTNAKRCFIRYNKLKKGQQYMQEQIAICEKEIDYFTGLLEQLDQADVDTAKEIEKELEKLGYLKARTHKGRRKKGKEEKLHISEVTTPSGIRISWGRNNMQNDALTWHTARKDELWLHAKDYHGAHVVIHDEQPDEETLRIAANIAAYYSKGRNSSSVPVNYCKVRQLKKIPGAKPGMVQLTNYHTIYIDPDDDQLSSLGIPL